MNFFSKKKSNREAPSQAPAPGVLDGPTLAQEDRKTAKQYNRAIWWVTNREGLKRIGVGVVILLEVLLGVLGILKYADYFLFDYVDEQRLVLGFFENTGTLRNSTRAQAPIPLDQTTATALLAGDEYDLAAFITNENAQWVARVTYFFSYEGGVTEEKQTVVLQDTTHPLVAFGIEERPRNPQLVVEQVEWYRIEQKDIANPVAWKNERLNLVMEDVVHDPAFRVGSETFGRTSFLLSNPTGYGYYEIDLYVVLKRANTVVGVNRTVISSLEPTETRPIQLNWFGDTPSATEVELYPIVNLFESDVYLPSSAAPAQDVRDIQLRRR